MKILAITLLVVMAVMIVLNIGCLIFYNGGWLNAMAILSCTAASCLWINILAKEV